MSFLVRFILAIRAWIFHEQQVATRNPSGLADIGCGDACTARAVDALAAAYRDLTMMMGLGPSPDHLLRLGPVGEFIHTSTCQTRGSWAAFRGCVERRFPGIPYPTPLTYLGHVFASVNERLLFHWIERQSGLSIIAVHPSLGRSGRQADFLVTGATGGSVYIEMTMLGADPTTDTMVQAAYRLRFAAKLVVYAKLGLELPVVIGLDDLSPRSLDAKMAEIRERLGLPVSLPRPVGWYEGEIGGWP